VCDTGCIPIFCNNTSAINIAKNPCQHKRTKHIDIRNHFLRDNVEKGLISLNFCVTNNQIADIFTGALTPNDWLVKKFQVKHLSSLVAVNRGAIVSTCVEYNLLIIVTV